MDEHRFVIRVLAAAQVKQVSSRFSAIVHLLALTVNSLLHWDDNSILSVSDVIDISVGKFGLSLLLNQGLNSWHGRASVSLLLIFLSVTPAFWVNLSLASWKKNKSAIICNLGTWIWGPVFHVHVVKSSWYKTAPGSAQKWPGIGVKLPYLFLITYEANKARPLRTSS